MSITSTSRWFRFNSWLHRWTSLLATLPFLVLCLTGTVLIFHEEIDHALGVVPVSQGATDAPSRPMGESIARVLAAYPDERVASTSIDEHHPGVLLVVTVPNDDASFDLAQLRYADLASGQLIGASDPGTTLTGFLLELHAQWFLGPVGELIGALIALLVLLSLLSGLVVYVPYVRRIALGIVRRDRGARVLQIDLHNLIGAVVLGWALVVTVTGFLLGFATLATGLWQASGLKDLRAQAAALAPVDTRRPPVDVDRVFAAARKSADPGWDVVTAIFPGTEFSTPRHYTVLLVGEGIDERLFRVAAIDAATGEVSASVGMPAYIKAITLAEPLHFGDYGGLALKLLWTACTWLTLFITANGAWLWWDRRRRRRHAASRVAAEAAV
jgi:uncharacterized iron-regulated membrane protein